jgi:hypothetical protein
MAIVDPCTREVLLSLQACRDRLAVLHAKHYKDNVTTALKMETEHERQLLLQLERLQTGKDPTPATGVTAWDHVNKAGL